jgi:exopolysaccharide biosynthesis polyprenyl glycosylphosphotransferase
VAEVRGAAVHSALAAVETAAPEPIARHERRASAAATWTRTVVVLDAGMLLAAALAADLGARSAGVPRVPLLWLVSFPVGILLALHLRSLHTLRIRVQVLDDVRAILTTTGVGAMAFLALRVLVEGQQGDLAAQTLRLWAFTAIYLAAGRVALDWSQLRARRTGEASRPTLIIGAGRVGHLAARRLLDHPEFGLEPVGFLDKEPLDDPRSQLPVLGASWDLERVLEDYAIEHVLVTFSTAPNEVLLRTVERCEELGIEVSLVPRLFERVTNRLEVEHIGGLPLLLARRPDPKGLQFAVKYTLDRLVAFALFAVLSPLLLALAIAVRLSAGTPVIFRQRRIGLDGREFEMIKFRTMSGAVVDAATPLLPADTAPGGVEGLDRRTRLGSWLRRTSLDELPQIVNVLRGEMSLIGPRPERPEFVRMFERNIYRYGDRHRVKSGVTGWAQVHGLRGKTSITDRAEWDNFYIENFSLWLDLKIMLLTLGALSGHFAKVE